MKIYIETYGCAANQADSDEMATLLSEKHEIVDSDEKADLIILNSCGVKGSTENKILARLDNLKGKKVIIAGCLPKIIKNKLKRMFPKFSLIGPDEIMDIERIVNEVSKGKRVIELEEKSYCLVPFSEVKEAQPIVICKGCAGNCAYCASKLARGKIESFSVDCIKKIVESAVKKGAKKILLTAQDTGAYGIDIGLDLPILLSELVKLPGDFKIRVGMMNPNHALKFMDRLVEIYMHPKIMKFLHIPVQAGSDKVLKDMRRQYTVVDFEKIVETFRKKIPEITISTDIICGFPTETEADFEKTIELVERVKLEVVNISKFYPRPGTEAKKMKLLSTEDIKARSRKLSELYAKLRKA